MILPICFIEKHQDYFYHSVRNEIIEHSICSNCIQSHNGNDASNQVECLEYAIIEDPFEDLDG